MSDLITRYFHDAQGEENCFFPPATLQLIVDLEKQLAIELPSDYKEFLLTSNGFSGFINEFCADFDPVEDVYKSTQTCCSEFFPWAIYIGSNASGEMFVIDKREKPYKFGLLPYISSDEDFIPLGDSFEKFITHLYNDTAFDR